VRWAAGGGWWAGRGHRGRAGDGDLLSDEAGATGGGWWRGKSRWTRGEARDLLGAGGEGCTPPGDLRREGREPSMNTNDEHEER
jgi:hypothetical protein